MSNFFIDKEFGISWDQKGLLSSDMISDKMFETLSKDVKYINQIPKIELINIGM